MPEILRETVQETADEPPFAYRDCGFARSSRSWPVAIAARPRRPRSGRREGDHDRRQFLSVAREPRIRRASCRCSRPISNGGVIVTDWYEPSRADRADEGTVTILDQDLRADGAACRGVARSQPGRAMGRIAGGGGDGAEARGHHPDAGARSAPCRHRQLKGVPLMASRFNALKADAAWQKVGTRPHLRRQR